ncbi:hypothetical protein ACKI2N_008525 [Cupriavidus sp. 30B13]|uniref:hypothetical protein n=1 Tax=Cupriavidus sp. 30B13 TaxID=3384241 RepID=UPI003B90235A
MEPYHHEKAFILAQLLQHSQDVRHLYDAYVHWNQATTADDFKFALARLIGEGTVRFIGPVGPKVELVPRKQEKEEPRYPETLSDRRWLTKK